MIIERLFENMVISDNQLNRDCAAAITSIERLTAVSYLFEENTLKSILTDLANIKKLAKEVADRIDNDRQMSAMFLQNARVFPVDQVSMLFKDKLPSERIAQLVQQVKQGNFTLTQTGLNVSKTASVRESDKPARGSIDWSRVQSYLEENGIDPSVWSGGNLARANGSFASFRRIAAEILQGKPISEKDKGTLRDGPKTRDIT